MHDFKNRYYSAIHSRNQLLRNNCLQLHRKLYTDLLLLIWRENINGENRRH